MESIGQINIDVDRKIDNLIQLMSNVRYVVVSCANVLVHEHVVAAGGGGVLFQLRPDTRPMRTYS